MSSGLNSQGSKILHSQEISPPAYVAIEQVTSIGGPDGSASLIDVSHLLSTGKEYLQGLGDAGQIQIECNYAGGAQQLDLFRMFNNSADPEAFKIMLPTSSAKTQFYVFEFLAICMKWSLSAAVDAKQKLTITLQVSGQVNYNGIQ
jgi:Lambda phage tail tube protein, TTP